MRNLNKTHGGMWEPTNGLVISGEASKEAIKRELKEEIGLDIEENKITLIKEIVEENEIETIVLGLPKHMNGDIGERGQISIEFKKQLEEMIEGINVILVDERLTTVVAENQLLFADVSRKKRKQVIDKMAAVAILQGYLDRG